MMRSRGSNKQRGSVMIEFALAGTVGIVLMYMTIQMCIGLWRYHTLAYAVHEATRYAAAHGRGCVSGANNCGITVGDIATKIRRDSIGIPPSELNVTLTTDSGATTPCSPITTCTSNTSRWPPTSNLDNVTGKKVTIAATFFFKNMMFGLWPGQRVKKFASVTFPASSTETVVF
jgi:hypothetical protein